jgi:hypothetical protein
MNKEDITNFVIYSDKCFFCGKSLIGVEKEKHHAIPKCLKPSMNVLIPMHKECHAIINKMYINQQKKPQNRLLKRIKNLMRVLLTVMDSCEEMQKEIENEQKES